MRNLIVIMGPSGSGKTTLASAYAEHGDHAFIEADDYHPSSNIALMRSGQPLDDSHRVAWLDALIPAVDRCEANTVILACSALTRFVQDRLLSESGRRVTFVYCDVSPAILEERLHRRQDHFMPPALLASQLAALQLPREVVRIAADGPLDEVVARLETALDQQG